MQIVPDHPRSRGVYLRESAILLFGGGSSPLARGLLKVVAVECQCLGIIPARAGFTMTYRAAYNARSDHPRSRGVYELPEKELGRKYGSSPLARGLRDFENSVWEEIGIIPARAGFTAILYTMVAMAKDHPRSRGVYGDSPWPPCMSSGSSPLARGLLWCSER